MLAKLHDELPRGPEWRYEPKWDGFRAIVFLDGADVHIGSRGERPLHRYFPELPSILRDALPARCVVDGEIVLPQEGKLRFDTLQLRIHPAESRIRMLAEQVPATFVAFDLLAEGDRDLREEPLSTRWDRLTAVLDGEGGAIEDLLIPGPRAVLTPSTRDPEEAADWVEELEAIGLDGVIAKRDDLRYRPGERAMVKVKQRKTADCVVGGYRLAKDGEGVGSLLLGLYDESGQLRYVGFASSFRASRRRELQEVLRPVEGSNAFGPGGPGGPSRWRREQAEWVPLEPRLVVEVEYDHVTGDRFRHGTRLVRFRDDKRPEECTLDQIVV